MAKKDRQVFDLHQSACVAYPRTGFNLQGKVQIFTIPKEGTSHSMNIVIEGDACLSELRRAVDYAMGN